MVSWMRSRQAKPSQTRYCKTPVLRSPPETSTFRKWICGAACCWRRNNVRIHTGDGLSVLCIRNGRAIYNRLGARTILTSVDEGIRPEYPILSTTETEKKTF